MATIEQRRQSWRVIDPTLRTAIHRDLATTHQMSADAAHDAISHALTEPDSPWADAYTAPPGAAASAPTSSSA